MKLFANKFSILMNLFLVFITPVHVFAAESAAHGEPPSPDRMFVVSVINFIILVLLLYFFLKSKSRDFFRSRSTQVRLDIEKASQLYADAYRKYEEIEAKLKNADIEGKNLLQSLTEEAELEKNRMFRASKEFSEKLKIDAERIVDNEVKRAMNTLKSETVALATQLATEQLEKEMTEERQKDLSLEFINKIDSIQ